MEDQMNVTTVPSAALESMLLSCGVSASRGQMMTTIFESFDEQPARRSGWQLIDDESNPTLSLYQHDEGGLMIVREADVTRLHGVIVS